MITNTWRCANDLGFILVLTYSYKSICIVSHIGDDIPSFFRGIMSPVCQMVDVHDELKRARDAFYSAMFEDNEEEMRAANDAVGYYESMDCTSCPQYPGF